MGSYENFYGGSNQGLSPTYGNFTGYKVGASQISFPTDATTSNQLRKVSDKISTGTKNIEVSGLNLTASSPMGGLASIPKQHWEEINRLRKLTGVDLTFHGPLVEPTGFSRGNWSEDQRIEVERQMKDAINIAQKIDPGGNVVVTFHSSNGLPEVRRNIKVGTNPDGSPIEKTVQLGVVNERTGELGPISLPGKDFLSGGDEVDLDKWLVEKNKEIWTGQLNDIGLQNNRARTEVNRALGAGAELGEEARKKIPDVLELYSQSKNNPQLYQQTLNQLKKEESQLFESQVTDNLNEAGFFSNQAYVGLKNSFNEAYFKAKDKDDQPTLNKLNDFQKEMAPVMKAYDKDRSNIIDFQKTINKGLRVLDSIKPPETFKPLEQFAIDKASESFANTALFGFKKFGPNAPIISIENPPAGMSGLTRGEELRDLAKMTRKKFVQKAVETGMSKSSAEKQAEKLIGVTWDTGHINSIRKWGYDEADVVKEAKAVAPFVKHVHAVDNLGFEDSELPPGMGNVPFEKILKLHPNFQKAKKVIEASGWYSPQGGLGMKNTPAVEAFEGFGSDVYMGGGPSWSQASSAYGGYFGGLGDINPQVHHSIYGGGFSNLPSYLGGEIPGASSNSNFSGTPIE